MQRMTSMADTQEHRLIRIATPLGGDELLITGFRGHEEISRLFHFELSLLSHNHSIAFKSVIGGNVTVAIRLENGEDRFLNGIVASFSQSSGNVKKEGSEEDFSLYTATIVPWLWLLTKTADLRIFQSKTAVDIIEQIFSEKGLSDYTKKLNGTYRPRDYCVQYRETDFNFISRLMEEEGISYYFTHESGKHTLVLADATNAYSPCLHYEKVRYQVSSGSRDALNEDMIKSLMLRNEIRVGKISLNDYNFEVPNTKLLVEMESRENLGPGEKEVYDYPGLYTKKDKGDDLARVRIQEEEARIVSISGTSDVRGFASGYFFSLEEYFRNEMNNKKYLLTAVDHAAEQQGFRTGGGGGNSYTNSFTCIPLDTPFRPPRLTPKPVVEGVQTAVVVGPAGEEIYTDKYGRVKVQFHWDRESKANENSSCWMRVGQIWAGTGWGAMYIPRIGQEVIVDFLEGDPDRPIVIGSVYHGTNMPPYPLPDEKTKTTIKSNSSKGGGGFNEIRLEDKKGSEQIFIHGEKDFDLRVKNDRKEYIGNERHLTVEKDQFAKVKKSKHLIVKEDLLEKVDGEVNTTIGGDRVVKVGGGDHLNIGGDFMMKTKGSTNVKSTIDHKQESGGNFSIKSGGDTHLKAGGNIGMEGGQAIHIKGGSTVVIEAGMQLSLKVGGNFIDIGPAGVSIQGTMVLINSGGAAGTGSGCSPSPPAAPDSPDEPKEAKLPVDAKPGKVDQAPEGRGSNEGSHPQAQALIAAAKDGTPLCKT
jgi:type VI secretion system secreted protein VgrG